MSETLPYAASDLILDAVAMQRKTDRIAYQILEHNLDEPEIVLAGIADAGYTFAQLIQKKIEEASHSVSTSLIKISLTKTSRKQPEVALFPDNAVLKNKAVILIDDVLDTGRTLTYSLMPFLTKEIKSLQVAVMVNRDHKTFPVVPDYVGYALSTTVQEQIRVVFEGDNPKGVYLL